ncbi:NAD(P)/FAD-dependent oxidoreductase [Clostridium sp.]|jgi:glycine/D-amino acid oxidase-like deaminating enzyme|uniref:NAD(P)/FAD-dependent oxidoreductase n=1 Tax=Clostridium sp. TaxID=1506 RepID=UPI0039F5E803
MTLENKYTYCNIINRGYIRYPALSKNEKCDVVVIGGGISGCLTTYFLSQHNLDTILIEKDFVANDTNYSNLGFLENRTDFSSHKLTELIGKESAYRAEKLCKRAVDILENILYNINYKHIFQRNDFKYIFNSSSKGCLENYEVIKNCAVVDPFKLCHVILKASLKKSARVYENTCASGYDYYSNNLRVNLKNSNYIECKNIIFTDIWTSYKLIKEWELLEKSKVYNIITEPLNNIQIDSLQKYIILQEDDDLYTYIKPTIDKRLMISEFNGASSPDKESELLNKLKDILSCSKDLKSEYFFEKSYAQSPDGLPYIGRHPKFNGCYFNLALGRNNICYSLIGAEIIKDLILYESSPDAEIFSFERN